jgi:hypothetical protein
VELGELGLDSQQACVWLDAQKTHKREFWWVLAFRGKVFFMKARESGAGPIDS